MAQAKKGDTVKVNYTGKFDDGSVFDSSVNRAPLEFTIGSGQVIPGFDDAATGMGVGDSKTVRIPATEAYGPVHEELVMVVSRNEFPEDLKPEVGDQLQLSDPSGQVMVVTVTSTCEDSVTLDGNHPLAGKDLTFEIEMVEIV